MNPNAPIEKPRQKAMIRVHRGVEYIYYHCPGCQRLHSVPTKRWHWNGSVISPTLSPSVRHYSPAQDGHPEVTHCHYFIKEGKIEFCGDCPHAFSGKTVELEKPELEKVPDNS